MKDPLVQTARFTIRERGWSYDWRANLANGDSMFLCEEGLDDWFEIPPKCTTIWAVVCPYPHPESYPIMERLYRIEFDGMYAGIEGSVTRWIREHISKYPQYNWYVSIEVYAGSAS